MTVAPERRAAERTQPLEPYKGLLPYSEADYAFFFGRERESEIIGANLMASRLTLLYGESGVGKSSVLLAGAVHGLREEARRNMEERGRPEFAVAVMRGWRDDPVQGLLAEVAREVTELVGGDGTVDLPEGASLSDHLQAWTEKLDGDLIVILDQFEEYFMYHGAEDGDGTFAVEFPRAVNRLDLRVSFLVSMREDSLAKLDRFKGRIPGLFDNRLQIHHLSLEAARQAIEGPIDAYNDLVEDSDTCEAEPELVDAVLQQIGGGHVQLGQVGAGEVNGGSATAADDRVEAPYLQVVLRRLWLEEVASGSRVLRKSTLDRLGGAEEIVRTRLDELMTALTPDERETAAGVFHYLVTRSGTKVAHTASDLAEFADLPEDDVAGVVEHLAAGDVRLLRPIQPPPGVDGGTRYEIFHDVIGPAILDWRARYVADKTQREAEERTRRERRKSRIWAIVAVLSLVACAAVAILGIWAVRQKNQADEQSRAAAARQREARAQELAAQSFQELGHDPARALSLAVDALDLEGTDQARQAFLDALAEFRVTSIMPGVQDAAAAGTTVPGAANALVAFPDEDDTIRVFDPISGDEVAALEGHSDRVLGSAFSRNGKRLVTASADDTARVWDSETGEELSQLQASDDVLAVAIDPVGARAAATSADGKVYLWDAVSGERLAEKRVAARRFRSPVPFGVEFSGDGDRVVTMTDVSANKDADVWAGDTVRVWNVSDAGLEPIRWRRTSQDTEGDVFVEGKAADAGAISVAELNEDGTRVVTAFRDGSIQIWNAEKGKLLRTFGGTEESAASDIALSPNGKLIAAAQDKGMRVWSTSQNRPIAEMQGHPDAVNVVDFTDDGTKVLSGSADGTARLWDARTGLSLLVLREHDGGVGTIGFVDDGTTAVTVSEDGTARGWDIQSGLELRGHKGAVLDATFRPDGQTLATVGADGNLNTWNVRTGRRLAHTFADYAGRATSVEYSPDGTRILTTGEDTTATYWDATTLELGTLVSHDDLIYSGAFNPEGDRIVTASRDSTAKVWKTDDTDELVFTLDHDATGETHEKGVFDAVYTSGDGARIVTVGGDQLGRVWSADKGEELHELEGHEGPIYGVAANPEDPRLVVTASRDRTAKIWDVETGEVVAELSHPEAVTAASFSPDGERIVTVSTGGVSRIWDWREERLIGTVRAHADVVNSAEFSPTEDVLATASDDRSAKIYACETCAPLEELVQGAKAKLDHLGEALPR